MIRLAYPRTRAYRPGVGLLDGIRSMVEPMPVVVERTEAEYDALVEALYDVITARRSSFTLDRKSVV